jgi:hypothetical protein
VIQYPKVLEDESIPLTRNQVKTHFDIFTCTFSNLLFCVYVVKPVAEIWGLLAIRLADDLILPFDYQSYASQLEVFDMSSL